MALSEEMRTELLNNPDLLLVGQMIAAHGIKGGVRVRCSESALQKFLNLSQVQVHVNSVHGTTLCQLLAVQQNKGALVVFIEGVTDRNSAESLIGGELFVQRSDVTALEEDEWWIRDLVGFAAFTADGKCVGIVSDIIATGNTLLELTPSDQSRKGTILIPFVKEIVPHINVAEKRIEISPVPGLLDL